MLLGASNYTMQVLCAPTRAEVDQAHAKGDWLDIGVPSFRNIMGRISKKRVVLWWLLALSSIPVHLMYNSVIFKTLDTNDYDLLLVNDDFLDGKPFRMSQVDVGDAVMLDRAHLDHIQEFFATNQHNSSLVQNLTNADCMRRYGVEFVSGRSNVLLVIVKRPNQSVAYSFHDALEEDASLAQPPTANELTYSWICPSLWYSSQDAHCDVSNEVRDSEDWIVDGWKVRYCLSQVERPRCKLQFSLWMLFSVMVMNAIKAGCMFWSLWRHRDPGLVTFGDAVSSFLARPDERSKGQCLMSKFNFNRVPPRWSSRGIYWRFMPFPRPFYALPRSRWSVVTAGRSISTVGLCLLALALYWPTPLPRLVAIWLGSLFSISVLEVLTREKLFTFTFPAMAQSVW